MSSPPARRRRIEVDDMAGVSIVRFVDRRILDDHGFHLITEDLFRLVDELGRRRLIFDLREVEFMSSALLGTLVRLQRKLQAVRGKMAMCRVAKDISDLFQITKVDRIVPVVRHPDLKTPVGVILEVFGDPLNPVAFDPNWKTDTVLALAKQIRETSEFGVMPILADALQDAGCTGDELLDHLRDADQPHVKECWALDLILGRAGPGQ